MSERKPADEPIAYVASTSRGRAFLADLLVYIRPYGNTFSSTGTHPELDMAYKEGRKSVGYYLLNTLADVCPEYLQLLRKEHDPKF